MTGILHVSTGNLRRSPMAEMLMTARLREQLGTAPASIAVRSAGMEVDAGTPLDAYAAAALADRGVTPGPFGARQLSVTMVRHADLVLTAARAHRDDLRELVPSAAARIFTVRELPQLLDGVCADDVAGVSLARRARALAELASERRRRRLPPPDTQLDVHPLSGLRLRRYLAAAWFIDDAVSSIVSLLVPEVMPEAVPEAVPPEPSARVITLPGARRGTPAASTSASSSGVAGQ